MRNRTISSLLLIVALFSACGGQPKIEGLTGDSTVVAFGDSLTFGFGVERDESYPSVLAELLECRVINAGISGETTSEGLRRLPVVLEKNQPDLVILCLGGNDMLQKQSKKKLKANLVEMIRLIKNANAEIIMVGVPEPGLLLRTPALYGELADEYDLPFDAKTIGKVLSSSSLKSDLAHPNEEGYRIMAQSFFSLIRESGGS
ncbi:MAG: arylesterase [Verrucomicrobia bacterium]|nr:arylesterase [Verrucomicrobiota bacterium]